MQFEQARKGMVDTQLRTGAITDRRILNAMGAVPRELFVPEIRQSLAYIDEQHRLGQGRWLAAPAPFAKLIQLAGIKASDKVLDVGCATGYSTAVLSHLAAEVLGIDDHPDLVAWARAALDRVEVRNAHVEQSALDAPPRGHGPFDVIVIEGAVERVPEALLSQLADGGRLVALIQQNGTSVAHLYVRSGRDITSRAEFNATLPPLPSLQQAKGFAF